MLVVVANEQKAGEEDYAVVSVNPPALLCGPCHGCVLFLWTPMHVMICLLFKFCIAAHLFVCPYNIHRVVSSASCNGDGLEGARR